MKRAARDSSPSVREKKEKRRMDQSNRQASKVLSRESKTIWDKKKEWLKKKMLSESRKTSSYTANLKINVHIE